MSRMVSNDILMRCLTVDLLKDFWYSQCFAINDKVITYIHVQVFFKTEACRILVP